MFTTNQIVYDSFGRRYSFICQDPSNLSFALVELLPNRADRKVFPIELSRLYAVCPTDSLEKDVAELRAQREALITETRQLQYRRSEVQDKLKQLLDLGFDEDTRSKLDHLIEGGDLFFTTDHDFTVRYISLSNTAGHGFFRVFYDTNDKKLTLQWTCNCFSGRPSSEMSLSKEAAIDHRRNLCKKALSSATETLRRIAENPDFDPNAYVGFLDQSTLVRYEAIGLKEEVKGYNLLKEAIKSRQSTGTIYDDVAALSKSLRGTIGVPSEVIELVESAKTLLKESAKKPPRRKKAASV